MEYLKLIKTYSFYIFWGIMQLGKAFGFTNNSPEFKFFILLAMPFYLLKYFTTEYSKDEKIIIYLLNTIGIIIYLKTKVLTPLLLFIIISNSKKVNIFLALKITFLIRGIIFVIRSSLAILNIIDIQMIYRDLHGVITGVRYGLGYGHPNTTQFELLILIMICYLLFSKKMKWIHHLIVFSYNFFIFTYTDSRTSFLLGCIFIIGSIILSLENTLVIKKSVSFFFDKIWIIGYLVSLFGCICYKNNFIVNTLGTFSARFQTAIQTVETNNITLFGSPGITTDLGYVYIIYSFGVVAFILYAYSIWKISLQIKKQKNYILEWTLICMGGVMLLEHAVLSILSNSLLLYFTKVLYTEDSKKSSIIFWRKV